MKEYPGILIAVEGTDGTGKSTQVGLLFHRLVDKGISALRTREPTDGPYGKKIRELYSNRSGFSAREELDLFLADRRQHVAEVIRPALEKGKVVITDRYYYSTAAYQGARGLDPDAIIRTNETFAPRPDLVIVLFLPADQSLQRIRALRGEEPNDFEQAGALNQVADIFANMKADNIRPVDASGSVRQVHEKIVAQLRPLFKDRFRGTEQWAF